MRDGDRLLLCSDGLSDYVDPERIERARGLERHGQVAAELVQLALEAGAPDNVTRRRRGDHREQAGAAAPGHDRCRRRAPRPAEPAAAPRAPAQGHRRAPPSTPRSTAEELRYAPRAPHRFRWLRRVVYTLVVLALLAAAGCGHLRLDAAPVLRVRDDGHVAIYKGVQADVPGLTLSRVFERKNLLLSQLPTTVATRSATGSRRTTSPTPATSSPTCRASRRSAPTWPPRRRQPRRRAGRRRDTVDERPADRSPVHPHAADQPNRRHAAAPAPRQRRHRRDPTTCRDASAECAGATTSPDDAPGTTPAEPMSTGRRTRLARPVAFVPRKRRWPS